MRRLLTILGTTTVALLLTAGPALACGGLIGPNGAVNLLRTTTFAGYHDGVEHYVTAFEFAGGGGAFGSLIPLPGVPSERRAGRRLDPPAPRQGDDATGPRVGRPRTRRAASRRQGVQVLLETRIDALDITVLKGGGERRRRVGQGARLPAPARRTGGPRLLRRAQPDLPRRGLRRRSRAAARGQQIGDGTPVHITIPTPNPWVPLRILALGKTEAERVDADVFLLTDRQPALLPAATTHGLSLAHDAPATDRAPGRSSRRPGHGVGARTPPG